MADPACGQLARRRTRNADRGAGACYSFAMPEKPDLPADPPPRASGFRRDGEPGDPHQEPNGPSPGSRRSGLSSSSTLTSLNVSTRTFFTNRAGRYMSHTHASDMRTSK